MANTYEGLERKERRGSNITSEADAEIQIWGLEVCAWLKASALKGKWQGATVREGLPESITDGHARLREREESVKNALTRPVGGGDVLEAWLQERLYHPFPRCAKNLLEGPSSPVPSGKILIQAFLSQEKDVTPDKNLLPKVQDAALWLETLSDTKPAKSSPSTTSSIADFFLALTICNSVMVSTTTEPRQRVRITEGGWWDGWEES